MLASGPLVLGTLVAFACAVVAVGVDLQDAVKTQLGALANTFVLQCWQGWAALFAWGIFDAGMYHVILNNQQWASNTFGFDVKQNPLLLGIVVGVSAVVVIRSKLAKVGNFEVGGEWLYLWSRATVLNAINKRRVRIKRTWQAKFRAAIHDTAGLPTFFTDLEAEIRGRVAGRPDISTSILAQLDDLRKQYVPTGDPNPDATINRSERARSYLVSLGLDYFGHRDLQEWATASGIVL